MALRVRAGNNPILDGNAFVHAALTAISLEENDKFAGEAIRWEFTSPGTIRPIAHRMWTGCSYHPPDDKGQLNKLSLICTKLGLFTIDDLIANTVGEPDLEALLGVCVIFHLVREGGLYRIDLPGLALDIDDDTPAECGT